MFAPKRRESNGVFMGGAEGTKGLYRNEKQNDYKNDYFRLDPCLVARSLFENCRDTVRTLPRRYERNRSLCDKNKSKCRQVNGQKKNLIDFIKKKIVYRNKVFLFYIKYYNSLKKILSFSYFSDKLKTVERLYMGIQAIFVYPPSTKMPNIRSSPSGMETNIRP